MYAVKEIYYTLQGEGVQTGRAAVFCRFAGCNLWSGRDEDRAGAVCNFCDTDFVGTDGPGGGKFATPESLAGACREMWRGNSGTPPLWCDRGEQILAAKAGPAPDKTLVARRKAPRAARHDAIGFCVFRRAIPSHEPDANAPRQGRSTSCVLRPKGPISDHVCGQGNLLHAARRRGADRARRRVLPLRRLQFVVGP